MAKYCVIPGIGGSPDTEFIMGTYAGAEAECISGGGHVVEHSTGSGGCGTTTAVSSGGGGGAAKSESLAQAVVMPIRSLRDQLPDSALLRDLELVNYSPDLLRALDEDEALAAYLRDAVGVVSQFAVLALVDPQGDTMTRSTYNQELHDWLVGLAEMVRGRTDDEELGDAVNRLVGYFEQRIGQPISEMADGVRGDGSSASH